MTQNTLPSKRANLFRRLAANLYDVMIILALWIIATFLLLPFTHGQAIKPGTHWYQLYCLTIMTFYYCASWYYYQQTIGMKAWRIILVNSEGLRPTRLAVFLRFIYAIPAYLLAGIGVWFAWHDTLSKTTLMQCDEKG